MCHEQTQPVSPQPVPALLLACRQESQLPSEPNPGRLPGLLSVSCLSLWEPDVHLGFGKFCPGIGGRLGRAQWREAGQTQKEGRTGNVGRGGLWGGQAAGQGPWLSATRRGGAAAASSGGRLLTTWLFLLCRRPDPPTGLPPAPRAHAQEASLL